MSKLNDTYTINGESIIVDNNWTINVPEGFKYSTDQSIIGSDLYNWNFIIMADDNDNDFQCPEDASICFASEYTSVPNGPMWAKSAAEINDQNNIIIDEEDFYVSYWFDPVYSHDYGSFRMDVFRIAVGCGAGMSLIYAYFSDKELVEQKDREDFVKAFASNIHKL